jgi:uncharacterized caspase-like protein
MKRFFHIVGLIVAVLWIWHGGSTVAAPPPRIALVIGNSSYAEAPLVNPVNDAKLMSDTLRELGFDVIERTDADQDAIQLSIFELQDRLFEAGKDAVGLFFYAGHGVQVGGQNYLIPLNTNIKKEREVAVKAVSAGFILGQMEAAGNRMNIIILDACRNNPLTRSFRSASRGLARMDAPRGSLVAYSTGPGELAADGTGVNSPYTLALTEAMRTPGIPVEQMFKLVRNRVLDETNGEQIPWEESSLTGADFHFSVNVSITVEALAATTPSITDTAATTQQESLYWQSIKDSTDLADYEAYLAQYPKGTFAELAHLRAEKFKVVQTAAEAEAQRNVAEEAQRKAAELAFWEAIKDGEKPAEYQAYLDKFPDGRFATLARVRAEKKPAPPTTEVAVLAPHEPPSAAQQAAPLAPQPGSFDGDWVMEIVEQGAGGEWSRVGTKIIDSIFSAFFRGARYSGEVLGEVDAAGTLWVTGYVTIMNPKASIGQLQRVTAEWKDGRFTAITTAHWQFHDEIFQISLKPNARWR